MLTKTRALLVLFLLVGGLLCGIYLFANDEAFFGVFAMAVGAFNAVIVHAIGSWAEQMLLLTSRIARSGRVLLEG